MSKIAAIPVLKIKKLHEEAAIPVQMTEGSVGLDLASIATVHLLPTTISSGAYIIHTGIALEIPKGYHGQIHLRSSIGAKTKLRLANGTGIIDSDYRGEIMLLVENIGKFETSVAKGQRIAQFILTKNNPCKLELVEDLEKTARGTRGIGSTGR